MDSSCTERGLKGEYFPNMNLEGSPVMTRTDSAVNFAWGDTGISPQLLKNYSVRWTGYLLPPESGDFLIGFTGQDGYRLWLDGNLLVEDWTLHHPASTLTKKVHLEKDHPYSLKIEYFQDVRSSESRLIWSLPDNEVRKAVEAARGADLVIAVLGLSARIEGEEMRVNAEGFQGGDRTSIDLPAPQEQLLERVYAAGKPTVLVLMNGSALAVNWADANLPAILEAWYPGEEGGTAVADVLSGDYNPAGRLPVTFYKSVAQLPPFGSYSMNGRTYRYFTEQPLYPFGYGLSFSSFSYSDAKTAPDQVGAGTAVTASVRVTNSSPVAGDEVVELYLSHPGIDGAPIRSLAGFQRVHLAASGSQNVTFTLHDRELSTVDDQGVRRIVPGPVEVWIGGGQPISGPGQSPTKGVLAKFTITSEATLNE
jgi:beta-glucosidase